MAGGVHSRGKDAWTVSWSFQSGGGCGFLPLHLSPWFPMSGRQSRKGRDADVQGADGPHQTSDGQHAPDHSRRHQLVGVHLFGEAAD